MIQTRDFCLACDYDNDVIFLTDRCKVCPVSMLLDVKFFWAPTEQMSSFPARM